MTIAVVLGSIANVRYCPIVAMSEEEARGSPEERSVGASPQTPCSTPPHQLRLRFLNHSRQLNVVSVFEMQSGESSAGDLAKPHARAPSPVCPASMRWRTLVIAGEGNNHRRPYGTHQVAPPAERQITRGAGIPGIRRARE